MNKTINVFQYVRKSPDDKEGTDSSIKNQINFNKKIIKENGWILKETFIDRNISGSDRTRKGFLEMLKKLYSSEINIVVVKEQDRFCKDTALFMDTLRDFDNRRKKLYSCMQRKFLSHTSLGDSVRALMDGNYIFDLRKKAEVLLSQKEDYGKPISRPPFGYMPNFKFNKAGNKIPIDKKKETCDWIIDTKKAKIVKNIVNDYVSGINYKETIKKNKITKVKYYRIMKNVKNGIYSGYIYYVRKLKNDKKETIRSEIKKYKGNHEPIISERLFTNEKN